MRQLGMEPVLGDGLSSEIGCWMEACVASVTIRNAGEFNRFLKPNVRLFVEPLQFAAGELCASHPARCGRLTVTRLPRMRLCASGSGRAVHLHRVRTVCR